MNKDLKYWKENATDDYKTTPISVLRYIVELEEALNTRQANGEYIKKSEVVKMIEDYIADVTEKEEVCTSIFHLPTAIYSAYIRIALTEILTKLKEK